MIFTWGIYFKGLSGSVIINSYINLQETGYEFEHIGQIPDTGIVAGKGCFMIKSSAAELWGARKWLIDHTGKESQT